jgi:hypothetical protein
MAVAGAWLGNGFLTALAVWLAVTHEGPLTPATFITMAGCIFAGNLLPLASLALDVRWRRIELEAEAVEADVAVRDALARAGQVAARLDTAEGSLAQSLLAARQVPAQMEAVLKRWNLIVGQFEEQQWPTISQQLDLQLRDLDYIKDRLAEAAERELAGADRELVADDAEDGDGSVVQRLDLLSENVEDMQEHLGAIQLALQALEQHLQRERPAGRRAAGKATAQGAAEPVAQEELPLEAAVESAEAAGMPAPNAVRSGLAVVRAHAMIGIRNRLMIRGDGGGLSMERGREMKLVGIGEYRFVSQPVDGPLRFQLYLNDEVAADEGELEVAPGDTRDVHPHFSAQASSSD